MIKDRIIIYDKNRISYDFFSVSSKKERINEKCFERKYGFGGGDCLASAAYSAFFRGNTDG